MESSPIMAVLLCALCIPAALPSGSPPIPAGLGTRIAVDPPPTPAGLRTRIVVNPTPIPAGLRTGIAVNSTPIPVGLRTRIAVNSTPIPVALRTGIAMNSTPIPAGLRTGIAMNSTLIPVRLRARIAVNSTPCSVTCGLGVRQERLCELTLAGERRNCSLVRSRCLSEWICGLRHLSAPEGKPFQLSCLSPDAASLVEGLNFGYTWRFARGLITTNDLLFQPFRNPSPSLSFSPALESHSGTYRCDVQELSSFRLVKRIYFGLRVIPADLVDLDFQKSLTWEQQLAANGEEPGNATGPAEREQRWNFWEKQWFYEVVLGIGSGVIMGILFSLGLCCLGRICRKRAAEKMNGA